MGYSSHKQVIGMGYSKLEEVRSVKNKERQVENPIKN